MEILYDHNQPLYIIQIQKLLLNDCLHVAMRNGDKCNNFKVYQPIKF